MTDSWLYGTTPMGQSLAVTADITAPPVPTLTLLYHSDLSRIGEFLVLSELVAGRPAQISRLQPSFQRVSQVPNAPLADPFVSRRPITFQKQRSGEICITPAAGGARLRVEGIDVVDTYKVPAAALEQGVVIEIADRIVLLLHDYVAPQSSLPTYELVGNSMALGQIREEIRRVASTDVSVLIMGETGTGKELVANAIHRFSQRRSGPFVPVNMAAIPPSLAASELFGAERGAYTGSTQRKSGLFQAAHGGTLFLDEIGETPTEIQAMLLRALETREIFPVGAQRGQKIDVRLLAATDADLEKLITRGEFRAPLLHRLSGYSMRLPPLRERRDDIGRLLAHFLVTEAKAVGEYKRLEYRDPHAASWLPAPLVGELVRQSWPGNVRQLQNVVRQLVISGRGRDCMQLGPGLQHMLAETSQTKGGITPPKKRKPASFSEAELRDVLRLNDWEIKAAAAALGISRTSLHARIEKCASIRKARDIDSAILRNCFNNCDGDIAAMVVQLEISEKALRRRLKECAID